MKQEHQERQHEQSKLNNNKRSSQSQLQSPLQSPLPSIKAHDYSCSSSLKYRIQSLRNEEDIKEWTQFCQDCFSFKKPNAPLASYFARHYFHDPRRDFRLIRVAILVENRNQEEGNDIDKNKNKKEENNGNFETSIASSIRIFRRRISTGRENCTGIEAGGIGEVCTSLSHRRRGLSKALLQDALQIMTSNNHCNSNTDNNNYQNAKIHSSFLHAAPQFMSIYEKVGGYQSVISPWSTITISLQKLLQISTSNHSPHSSTSFQHSFHIRLATFPQDTAQLQKIHSQYSEKRFAGCIIRDQNYWNQYIQHEIGDNLFLITTTTTTTTTQTHILAWMSLRPRGIRYQLREFGFNTPICHTLGIPITSIMPLLLHTSLQHSSHPYPSILDTNDNNKSNTTTTSIHHQHQIMPSMELLLPTPILDEIQSHQEHSSPWINWKLGVKTDNDHGWMYKTLHHSHHEDNHNHDTSFQTMINIVNTHGIPHIIWPSDSF